MPGLFLVLGIGDELAFVLVVFFALVVDLIGGVVLRFDLVVRMVARLFVRSVGLEGREVRVGVEGEACDRDLQSFPVSPSRRRRA